MHPCDRLATYCGYQQCLVYRVWWRIMTDDKCQDCWFIDIVIYQGVYREAFVVGSSPSINKTDACMTSLLSQDMSKCDLLIVMGTSLVVQPFASLVDRWDNAIAQFINKYYCQIRFFLLSCVINKNDVAHDIQEESCIQFKQLRQVLRLHSRHLAPVV